MKFKLDDNVDIIENRQFENQNFKRVITSKCCKKPSEDVRGGVFDHLKKDGTGRE